MFVDNNHVRTNRPDVPIAAFQLMSTQPLKKGVSGTEFVAMRMGVDTLRGLRYKLRMTGVSIDRATNVYGDNMSIITNTSKPESNLSKQRNAVCHHRVRELCNGETLKAYIPGAENPADLTTKVLSRSKYHYLVQNLLHDKYYNDMLPYPVSE